MSLNGTTIYPRILSQREKEWLFYLLPEDVPVYNEYRKMIPAMLVIGEGRLGEGNFVLGREGDEPDLSYPSLPMFACGQIICKECVIQISIHELYDNKIEFSINNILGEAIPDELHEIRRWSYSYWRAGSPSPFENDELREVNLVQNKNELVLVLSKAQRTIWLYESRTMMNHIIPVTNYINELLRGKRIGLRADEAGINVGDVFSHLKSYSDDDFREAFTRYNKYWKKVNLSMYQLFTASRQKSGLKKLFSRDK